MTRWLWIPAFVSALLLAGEARGQPADSLLARLDAWETSQGAELEARFGEDGDPEKRLLESRFGLFHHSYRVDADPRGIVRRYREEGLEGSALHAALEEIVAGRYAAYYFFDGVIRPNVFAPPRFTERGASALHEKVHLVQPALYQALGLRCAWHRPDDACVRSLEPVAVYLTEFATVKRASPSRTDESVNRGIERWLTVESVRCGYGSPVPRCPTAERVRQYVLEPLELARVIERLGVEEGIREYVESLGSGDLAGVEPVGAFAR
jgi:hypothetical protein